MVITVRIIQMYSRKVSSTEKGKGSDYDAVVVISV
jgi:hypothetical protein